MDRENNLRYRIAPLEMSPGEFRKAGYRVIDEIAEFICSLPERPVTPHEAPTVVHEALGTGGLPDEGMDARPLLEDTAHLLFDHSLFNGHPQLVRWETCWHRLSTPILAVGILHPWPQRLRRKPFAGLLR